MARSTVTRRKAPVEVGKATPTTTNETEPVEETLDAEEKTTRSERKSSRSSRVRENAVASAGGGWSAYSKAKEVAKKTSFNSEDQ
jgi:hypothetical protein